MCIRGKEGVLQYTNNDSLDERHTFLVTAGAYAVVCTAGSSACAGLTYHRDLNVLVRLGNSQLQPLQSWESERISGCAAAIQSTPHVLAKLNSRNLNIKG